MAQDKSEGLDVTINTNGAWGTSREREEMLERSGAVFGGKGMIRHATGKADGAVTDCDWRHIR